MPRTRLDKAAKRDPLKELFLGRLGVIEMSQAEFGEKMGLSQSGVSRWLKLPTESWKLGDIYKAAGVLRIPKEELRTKL